MSEFELSTDELIRWLNKKYSRHGEIEDGLAAERLKLLSSEVKSAFFAGYVYGCDHGQSPFDPKYTDVTAYEEWERVSTEQ